MSYNESTKANSNYPAMSQSEWDSAPFNQTEPEAMSFYVDVEYVLQKRDVSVVTNDYIQEKVLKDGSIVEPLSTEYTDWEEAYNKDHYTIPEMLEELKGYVERELEHTDGNSSRGKKLKTLLEDCQGWTVFDNDITESE